MTANSTKKSKTSKNKKAKRQLNLKYDIDFLEKLKKNAKRKDMTPTQYIRDLVSKDGWGVDNTEISTINTRLHIIDSWQKKTFYTIDSFAKLFYRYMFETFKYVPDNRGKETEESEFYHAMDKMSYFLSEYRARKNNYNNSFLEQMFKTVIETTEDFEKFNPMKAPTKEKILKQRYELIMKDEIKSLRSIFTENELEFIAILCHAISWNEVEDIKHKLLQMLNDATTIELEQMSINQDETGKKIASLKQVQLFALVEYIEFYCEINFISPIKENELFEKSEANIRK